MIPLRASIATATDRLAAAGVDSPRHDAEALAAHVLGVGRGELTLVTHLGPLAPAYADLVDRRAAREPLQHLVGTVGFRHLELVVGPGVFVPRPETESVVQWALDAARAERWPAPLVVDLCTGSGTMALSIAQELPGARVHGVERDPVALEWTARNAELRVAAGDPPVTLHLGDVADALPELDGTVDLVVSNPPYVAVGERAQVDPEVRDHDPEIALWAGDDGLDVIRLVEATARRLLHPGGLLVVEHSDRQGVAVPALLHERGGWTEIADHRDYADRDRYATARRTGTP
ncbi:MAG: peptide chain release factor N(5)-glutamine methyltransferase [Mycobacteriales bacterium]